MKRMFAAIAMSGLGVALSFAVIPDGYYSELDGKQGVELQSAIKALSDGHNVVTYGDKSWSAFEKTDMRMVDGREAWRDMYSNNLVWLPGHDGMNLEHSVANSWWGGKKGSLAAYSDLFLLNPSDADANNAKNNNPPGEVVDARILDNGLLLVGTPAEGQGGGSTSVFEPADEYKGDFARAYFYVFSAYSDLAWDEKYAYVYGTDGKLQQWVVDLLLEWNRIDPVDSNELNRNDEIYKLQNNRNPFIDYPALAEYVWGEKNAEVFSLAGETSAVAIDRPDAPIFPDAWTVGVNTYLRRWWDGFTQQIEYDGDSLWVSIDGRDYYEPVNGVEFDPALKGESHTIKAYVENEINGVKYRSSVSTLELHARNESEPDYSYARWSRVGADYSFAAAECPYIILSSNVLHAMSSEFGQSSSSMFMREAGFVEFDESGLVVDLQPDAAIVEIEQVGEDGKYRLGIKDINGNFKGYWNTTAKNKMKLDMETYTPGVPSIAEDETFVYTFDSYGTLQYNKTSPRFLNYESKQTSIYLYSLKDYEHPVSGVEELEKAQDWSIGVAPGEIIAPEGASVYDLNGRKINGNELSHGVYIVIGNGRSHKVIL